MEPAASPWTVLSGVVCLLFLFAAGCATMASPGPSPGQVQQGIHDGSLVKPGQYVNIVTSSGERYDLLKVLQVNASTLTCRGLVREEDGSIDENTFEKNQVAEYRNLEIAIEDIVSIEAADAEARALEVKDGVMAVVGLSAAFWIYLVAPMALVAFLM